MNPTPASATTALPRRVIVREMGLRDGLQSVQTIVPTPAKIEWIRDAYAAGEREIEVGSFVPPRLLPQLADTAEVLAFAQTLPGLRATVLVPNMKGAQRALEANAEMMLLPLSASHAHSLANLRKAPDDVVAEIASIRAERDASGKRTQLEVGISTAFGCTIQGAVDPDEVVRLVQAVLDEGVDAVSLADTVGYADPAMVSRLFERVLRVAGDKLVAGHFHDTRGLGLANVYAALQLGIARFDACSAGIGGCPHAPGASGNVATEDLTYMLHSMGIETGLDFDKLLALRAKIAKWLENEPTHGTIWKTGLPRTMKEAAHA
jgi:hydroxymethylglutaryl-CoA lyase